METLIYIILSTFLISIFSLVGIFTIFTKTKDYKELLLALVSLSTGTLIGGAFIHLIPESIEENNFVFTFSVVAFSIGLFYLIEHVLHWRHCHKEDCDEHTFGYMNLFGDAIHNFIDGLIIAGAFLTSIPFGITTSIAIAFHEIPQEIGDFGVLLYAGFTKKKALIANFMVATTAVIGGTIGYFFFTSSQVILPYLLPFAAGGFIYIAIADLIPEIIKEKNKDHLITNIFLILIGLAIMWGLKFIHIH